MFDLKCKRQDCLYNENCNCSAKNVEVNSQTDCLTYVKANKESSGKDKIKQVAIRKNTCVSCNAQCLFNKQSNCKANGITIITNQNNPKCSTFMPK